MNQMFQTHIKSSVLDRVRQLTITKDFIEYDDKDLISSKPTRIQVSEIIGIRTGVKWIRGYAFTIGRIYVIEIKDKNGIIIKITIKSLYGVNRNQIHSKYATIYDAIYTYILNNIDEDYIKRHSNGEEFTICGVQFLENGLKLNPNTDIVQWVDLGTKSFYSYFSIYSLSTPSNYKLAEYLTDWNAPILHSVSRSLLAQKGLYSESSLTV